MLDMIDMILEGTRLNLHDSLKHRVDELEGILKENTHVDIYLIDNIFHNTLGNIPKNFRGMQDSYLDLAFYYLNNFIIEEESGSELLSDIRELTGNLGRALNYLLNPDELPHEDRLGSSELYEPLANRILRFYNDNKEKPLLLKAIGKSLCDNYSYLTYAPEENHIVERMGGDISIIRNIVKENGEGILKDPLIVEKIFDKAVEKALQEYGKTE